MKSQNWFCTILILSFVLFLSACASDNVTNGGQQKEDGEEVSEGKVVIDFAAWGGPEEGAELQELVDEVNARAEDYEINLILIPDDYYTKLQVMIAGNNAPDIFYLSQEWIASYADKNALLDLTDYVENDEQIDLTDWYEEPIKTAIYNGRLYGLPWITQPVIMYYNKDHFDEAGIDYPTAEWDWDKFRQVAQELTKDLNGNGRIDQWGFIASGWPPPSIWIRSMGGEIIDAEGNVRLDEPEAIEGLTILYNILHEDGSVPDSHTIEQQGLAEMFKAGRISMFLGGAADDLDRIEGLNVGHALVPKGKERVTFNWIAHMAASTQTEHPDVTYNALRDMTLAIHTWKIVPPVISQSKNIQEIEPRKPDSAVPVILESMEFARGIIPLPNQQEVDTLLWEKMGEPLIRGEKEPEEIAQEAAEALRQLLGQ